MPNTGSYVYIRVCMTSVGFGLVQFQFLGLDMWVSLREKIKVLNNNNDR
jgi:hypothetical protein